MSEQLEPVLSVDAEVARSRELALKVADVITETPAKNTLVIDIHDLSQIADYFVITSGENERQLQAISRSLLEELAQAGTRPRRIEGEASSGWMLLDYGDVVVHIFDVDLRSFYGLEKRWSEAPTLLSIL
ncbi:MAG: ribosome silencing factor [Chloroflexota bacterium]|nr:ribosome silencing factor [Chloroflexota bacterium]